jgi:hypothetical protein
MAPPIADWFLSSKRSAMQAFAYGKAGEQRLNLSNDFVNGVKRRKILMFISFVALLILTLNF